MVASLFPDDIVKRMNTIKDYQQFRKTVALQNSTPHRVLIQDVEINIFSHGGIIFANEARVGWL
jgi:hypothetical protein